MKKEPLKYLTYALVDIATVCIGHRWNQARKLDTFYFEQLKTVKSLMIFDSTVDSSRELNAYQDQIELCMHLDGYNGIEVMKLRTKAFQAALTEGKNEHE